MKKNVFLCKLCRPLNVALGGVRKNSGGKRQAWYQSQVITGKRRSLSALAPVRLTTQVRDQRISTGQLTEWSDSGTPAQVGTGDLPVIKWQVLGLPFSTSIFRTLLIRAVPKWCGNVVSTTYHLRNTHATLQHTEHIQHFTFGDGNVAATFDF